MIKAELEDFNNKSNGNDINNVSSGGGETMHHLILAELKCEQDDIVDFELNASRILKLRSDNESF